MHTSSWNLKSKLEAGPGFDSKLEWLLPLHQLHNSQKRNSFEKKAVKRKQDSRFQDNRFQDNSMNSPPTITSKNGFVNFSQNWNAVGTKW